VFCRRPQQRSQFHFPRLTSRAPDESGLSFWLPGLFGSFAAAPGVPGWSIASFYYHPSVIGGGNKLFEQGGRIEAGLRGSGNLVGLRPDGWNACLTIAFSPAPPKKAETQ